MVLRRESGAPAVGFTPTYRKKPYSAVQLVPFGGVNSILGGVGDALLKFLLDNLQTAYRKLAVLLDEWFEVRSAQLVAERNAAETQEKLVELKRNGQEITSGVYLFSVEADQSDFERFVGKFVVIR